MVLKRRVGVWDCISAKDFIGTGLEGVIEAELHILALIHRIKLINVLGVA